MQSPLTLNPTSASTADGFSASSPLCPSNSGTKYHRMAPRATTFAAPTWSGVKISAKSVTSRATRFIPSWISPHQTAISAIRSASLTWENRHRIRCTVSHAEEEAAVRIGSHTSKERVDILSEALPFIQKLQGKTVVVKYGGAAMKDGHLRAGVINDLVLLSCVGMRPVFVHGGGPEINEWLGKVGIRPRFKDGLRVTDGATMELVEMVLAGKVNKSLVSLINRAGGSAVGLCGKDGRLITARKAGGDLGFVGEIASTNTMVIKSIVNIGSIPVVASVAADSSGQSYNINADTVAGEIAASLGAEKLILLTDVAGLLLDTHNPRSLVKQIDVKGVKELVDEGKISGGMIPKVNCCVQSIVQGVGTASIIDGRLPHSLLLEILTDEGAGTMIIG